jgi:hypothetical protein
MQRVGGRIESGVKQGVGRLCALMPTTTPPSRTMTAPTRQRPGLCVRAARAARERKGAGAVRVVGSVRRGTAWRRSLLVKPVCGQHLRARGRLPARLSTIRDWTAGTRRRGQWRRTARRVPSAGPLLLDRRVVQEAPSIQQPTVESLRVRLTRLRYSMVDGTPACGAAGQPTRAVGLRG